MCAGVMIHKIDACMLDLLDFHTQDAEDQRRASLGGRKKSGKLVRTKSQRCVYGLCSAPAAVWQLCGSCVAAVRAGPTVCKQAAISLCGEI